MDKNEVVLLSYLRQNGRIALTILSRKTGIPVSTLHDRLKKTGSIRKIAPILHFGRMGYNAKAYVLMKANRKYKDKLQSFLTEHFHVNNLYKVNNGFDYMMECVFTDMKALEDFMDELDEKFKVRSSNVHYIINDIKREGFFADPQRIGELVEAKAA